MWPPGLSVMVNGKPAMLDRGDGVSVMNNSA